MNLEQRTATTSSETQHLSLSPVLSRIALGLLCVFLAAFLFQRALELPPELEMIETPIDMMRSSTSQSDIHSATLRFEGNHPTIRLSALPEQNTQDLLRGQVTHRVQNKMVWRQLSKPQDHHFQATLALNVKPLKESVVIGRHRHIIDTQLSPLLPLTLWTKNQWGDQNLDLSYLKIKRLVTETVMGYIKVKLPKKDIEKLSISSRAGNIKIDGREKIKIKQASVKNWKKGIDASLKNISFENLNIRNKSGRTNLQIGRSIESAEVYSERGEINMHLFKGAQGKIKIHSKEGRVNLYIYKGAYIRLKRSGQEALIFPENAEGKPTVEIYVDALDRYFNYQMR